MEDFIQTNIVTIYIIGVMLVATVTTIIASKERYFYDKVEFLMGGYFCALIWPAGFAILLTLLPFLVFCLAVHLVAKILH